MRIRGFYKAYGKHLWTMEALLIVAASLVFFVETRFAYVSLLLAPSLFTFVIIASSHVIICLRIAFFEYHPLDTLRLCSFHKRFYSLLVLSEIIVVLLLYVDSRLFPMESLTNNILVEILSSYALTVFAMLFPFFFYSITFMSNHKKTRLSLRTVLVGLKLISMEQDERKRAKLIRKYVSWFKDGLRSYNRYLYSNCPVRMEIVDVDDYYRSLCVAALMGRAEEIDRLSTQTRLALGSLRRGEKRLDNLKQFLIRLKNVKDFNSQEDYPLDQINEMTKVLSFSERLKTKLGSPYTITLIAIITVILQILTLIPSFGLHF